MTLRQALLSGATILLLSIGQILFKYSASKFDIQNKGLIFGVLLNPSLIIALTIYGIATILWLLVLRITPLRAAYPFVALTFVIVPLLASAFLGEPLKWTTFAGAMVIFLGVYISIS